MARPIHSRLKIKGMLTAETPLHVGGYGESFETDMSLARNGAGEFYIPGTSLAGSLRSWFEKNFPDETNKLWGFQKNDKGHASFVLIEDLTLPEQIQSELRDGVGIDRNYGTAADQIKFDRAILPKGTKLNLEMTVEIGNKVEAGKIKAMFGHLCEALHQGNIRLGASKTRGLGRVKFTPTAIEELLLDGKDENGAPNILNLVLGKAARQYQIQTLKDEDNGIAPSGAQLLTITIKWHPKSPVMVKAGYEGIGVDTLPLVSGNGSGSVSLVLPGSSIKGAFRVHAERIMRTVLNLPSKKDYQKQLNIDIVNELFGAKKERDGQPSHLGLGALSFDDCYAEKTYLSTDWNEVETGEMGNEATYSTQSLWEALKKIDKDDTTDFKISHHVAIDRWTGGASEGALFSLLQPAPTTKWNDICLSLDLSRLPTEKKDDGSTDDSLRKKCLMLLLLALRDFAENRLPLGFATNRGMGEVIVEKITGLEAIPKLLALHGAFEAEVKNEQLTFKGDEVKNALKGVLTNG